MRGSLTHEKSNCQNCPLFTKTKRPYVPTDLVSPGATSLDTVDMLFVGEAPGRDEDKMQLPFVGQSGQLLRKLLDRYATGLSYALANLVRCRPTTETGANRTPIEVEINFCQGYVRSDIKQLKPKVVVLLGGTAIGALNPDPNDRLWASGQATKARTAATKVADGVQYIATLHPAYVLRSPQQQILLETDLSKACNLARGEHDVNGELGESVCLDTVAKVEQLRDDILSLTPEDKVAFDTETANLYRVAENRVLSWQFAFRPNIGYVIPYHHKQTPFSSGDLDKIKQILTELLTSKEAKFAYLVMHNGPFDIQKMQRFLGIYKPARPVFDTQFGMYVYDENRTKLGTPEYGPYKLKTLAREFLGFYHYDNEAIAAREGRMEDLTWDKFVDYAGMDGYVTYRLENRILELAGKYAPKLVRFATKWQSRLARTLPKVEGAGIWTDKKQIFHLQGENSPILKRMEEIPIELAKLPEVKATNKCLVSRDGRTAGMQTLFGPKEPWLFDVDKKDHLVTLFFEILDLEPTGYGKNCTDQWPDGIPSVDKAFYEANDDVDIAKLVKERTGLKKLKSSYLNSIIDFLTNHPDMQDGRIRSSQIETRTVTGRLATKSPNTSQIPRPDNEYKKQIKSMFAAPPGSLLCETDYRQAEVRWWAQIAGDEEFAKLFWQMKELRELHLRNPHDEALAKRVIAECDIHQQVASLMHGVQILEVSKDQRQGAKNLCVSPGTFVRTDHGLEKIEHVVENWVGPRDLETRTGVEKATKAYKLTVDKTTSVYTDKGFELHGRPEHPVLAWRDCKLQLIALSALKKEDRVVLRRATKFWPERKIKLTPYVWIRQPKQTGRTPKPCNYPKYLNGDLARLAGYISSEGACTYKNEIVVCNTDKAIIEDIRAILLNAFGANAWVESAPAHNGLVGFTLNKCATFFLRQNKLSTFGEKAKTKQVPSLIWRGGKDIVANYLCGYFSGDGSFKGMVKAVSASYELAKQVQVLLLELGIISKREHFYTKTNKGEGWYWLLTLSGRDVDLFMDVIKPVRHYLWWRDVATRKKLWYSSNVDNIYGLQAKCIALRKANEYASGTGNRRKHLGIPWTRAKELSTTWVADRRDIFITSLATRDKQLSEDLKEILDQGYFLDSIAKKTSSSKKHQVVYDFTVPGSHTFVTQGFISRNTFGAIYGQSARAVAQKLGIEESEAEELQKKFFLRFRRAAEWLNDIEVFAQQHGYVDTPLGRRRHLAAEFASGITGVINRAKRQARNSPIQGASSDMMLLAGCLLQDHIEEQTKPWKLINVVHDAVYTEYKLDKETALEVTATTERIMTEDVGQVLNDDFGVKLIVPMEVEFKVGTRMGHMKAIDAKNSLESLIENFQLAT